MEEQLEQENTSAIETEASSLSRKKTERNMRILRRVALTFRLLIFLGMFTFMILIFFKVSNIIYDKTQVFEDSISKGTIDVYAQQEKKDPLVTFDAGYYNFETEAVRRNEVSIIAKTHIVLVYDPKKVADYDEDSNSNSFSRELNNRKLQIQDLIRSLIIQKDYKNLVGNQNMVYIKKELMNHINHILVNGKIVDIYFAEWNIIPIE